MSDELRASEVLQGGGIGPEVPPEQEPPTENLEKRAHSGTRTLWGDAWYRLRRNKLALVSIAWLVLLILAAVTAGLWVPQRYGKPNYVPAGAAVMTRRFLPPSAAHPLGTDDLGRDLFSRVVYGARTSLLVGSLAVLVSVLIGLLLGAVSGFYGGWPDGVIMRLADVFLAFPYILFAMIILVAVPDSARTTIVPVVITIGVLGWPSIARVFRSSILSVKENDYVDAGRALGAGNGRLISRHILPNAIAPIIVYATMSVGGAILTEAALSFLRLGLLYDPVANPYAVSWGGMIADGQAYLQSNPWIVIWPGLAIVTTVLAFTLLGDGVRDALDVKMKD
jgi:peptide/nickel transport system permease protein/oligopeptide transport system permease protein